MQNNNVSIVGSNYDPNIHSLDPTQAKNLNMTQQYIAGKAPLQEREQSTDNIQFQGLG